MTDQFSPEYKAYLLSDEAKGLQHFWQRKEGDRFAMGKDYVGLVTHPWKGQHDEATWLPTLWDLTQIIEWAGYSWTMGHYCEDGPAWYVANAVVSGEELGPLLEAEEWEDVMLAAAKLAVRTIESGARVGHG